MICSLYNLAYKMPDFTWLELVDFMDSLIDEPVFEGMQEVQVEPVLRANYPAVFARGNVPRTVSFSRIYTDFSSPHEARNWELEHLELLDGLEKSTARIAVKDGDSYLLSDAMLTGQPAPRSTDQLPTQTVIEYVLYCGSVTKVPPADLDIFVVDETDYFVIVD